MAWYLARRAFGAVVLVAVVVALTFVLLRLAPGDAALTLAGTGGADPEHLALLRHRLGLDRPLGHQIAAYVGRTLRGDLGFSVVQGRPVLGIILSRLPATLLLAGTALVLASVTGVILGAVAAARRGGRIDTAISVASLVMYSVPVFWLGQVLIAVFAVRLGWLPAGGMTQYGQELSGMAHVSDVGRHLILPAVTLAVMLLGLVVRTTRTGMVAELRQPYVTAARGRGVPERAIVFSHALRNVVRLVVTVLTGYVGLVFTGAILVESVFAWPGLGRLVLDALLRRDTPLLVGLLVFSGFVVAAANVLGDVLHVVFDPRIRIR